MVFRQLVEFATDDPMSHFQPSAVGDDTEEVLLDRAERCPDPVPILSEMVPREGHLFLKCIASRRTGGRQVRHPRLRGSPTPSEHGSRPPGPFHDGLRCASDDVGGPKDADTVGLTCHDEVVLLTGEMGVLIGCSGPIVKHTSAGLASVFADSPRSGLIGAVGYDVPLTQHPVMSTALIRTRYIQKALFRAPLTHLIT